MLGQLDQLCVVHYIPVVLMFPANLTLDDLTLEPCGPGGDLTHEPFNGVPPPGSRFKWPTNNYEIPWFSSISNQATTDAPTIATTATTSPPTSAIPAEPLPIAIIAGAAAGGIIFLLLLLATLCCCCYCCCCRSSSKKEYATGNEGRPWVVVRTYTQNVERHGSVISRGSRGSFARSSISSIASSLRRLSGKRRSKNKDTHYVNEDAVAMKVTPL